MVMSSRTAATRALWDLLKIFLDGNDKIRKYSEIKPNSISRSTYNRKLNKLQQYGLVHEFKYGTQAFVITQKAKILRSKAVTKKNRTDGFATLIIFDIPQKKRNARDTLRRYLIRSGYTQIRESCFLSPFEISRDLKDLIIELKLKQDVSIFSAKMNLI
jgi:DNA-binding transcriptional regulator PaaX